MRLSPPDDQNPNSRFTHLPKVTESWTELPVLERMRRKFLMDADDEKHTDTVAPFVREPGHDIPLDELCKQATEVAALLVANGRMVSARRSEAIVHGTPFKTGKRAGEIRPDKVLTVHALATTDFGEPVVSAVWTNNKLDFAYFGWQDGSRVRVTLVTELKQLIRTSSKGVKNGTGDTN